ncbi:hypothetical protein [Pseudomonas sivasensis]|nr:hypothetical protein [Pseudomonas sivasensis]
MDNANPAAALRSVEGRVNERVAVLERYYDLLSQSSAGFESPGSNGGFEPSMELPLLNEPMRQFLSVATAQFF